MKKLIFVFMILFTSPAIACDSYDECMNTYEKFDGDVNPSITNKLLIKGIAYKLDEISKKLDDDWIEKAAIKGRESYENKKFNLENKK